MSPTTHSDSEDDLDYVPPVDDNDSDSSDEQDEVTATTNAVPETDHAEEKKRRDALWASFQASVSAPSDAAGPSQPLPLLPRRVKVEKTYLFAGKHVRDVVEVPEDSEEAKKWPRWSPSRGVDSGPSTAPSDKGEEEAQGESPAPTPAPAVEPSPATPTPGPKRPGPRKPRTPLPSIPKTSQVKKITTLDKSAMDWRAHLAAQSSDVKDALDANRRGGGYLEKVDFLKRVQDRREDVLEASKLGKRRKT